MSIHEAFEVLGLSAGTEHTEARRAYMRLLRAHKPELDPAGFRRIQEAWESAEHCFEKRGTTPRSPAPVPPGSPTVPLSREPRVQESQFQEFFPSPVMVEDPASDLELLYQQSLPVATTHIDLDLLVQIFTRSIAWDSMLFRLGVNTQCNILRLRMGEAARVRFSQAFEGWLGSCRAITHMMPDDHRRLQSMRNLEADLSKCSPAFGAWVCQISKFIDESEIEDYCRAPREFSFYDFNILAPQRRERLREWYFSRCQPLDRKENALAGPVGKVASRFQEQDQYRSEGSTGSGLNIAAKIVIGVVIAGVLKAALKIIANM